MSNELRKLGECAGLLGRQASASEADKFDHTDPESKDVLVRTMRANDARNASEHAYLQTLDTELEEEMSEVAALEATERELHAQRQAASEAADKARASAARQAEAVAREEARARKLEVELATMAPHLESTLSRLHDAYADLDDAPVRVLAPLPARYVPRGLESVQGEQEAHQRVEVHLEDLDGVMQAIGSRVTRIAVLRKPTPKERKGRRASTESVTLGTTDDEEEEGVPPLHPQLQLFVELPPEASFAQTKAARAEMEMALLRAREPEDAPA